jgi:hypothetical protein
MLELRYQEQKDLTNFNDLLRLCKKPRTSPQLEYLTDLDSCTIRYKCNELVKFGYMVKDKVRMGKYQQIQNLYTTLKPEFDMSEYEELILQRRANKSKAGKKSHGDVFRMHPKDYIESSLAQPVYTHNPDKYREKYLQQARQIHAEQKSPRVFVSGNSDLI